MSKKEERILRLLAQGHKPRLIAIAVDCKTEFVLQVRREQEELETLVKDARAKKTLVTWIFRVAATVVFAVLVTWFLAMGRRS